jgi:hypothetical protein
MKSSETTAQPEIKRQRAKGKRSALCFFHIPSVARMVINNLKNKRALLPNSLLPVAFCDLPFDLHPL